MKNVWFGACYKNLDWNWNVVDIVAAAKYNFDGKRCKFGYGNSITLPYILFLAQKIAAWKKRQKKRSTARSGNSGTHLCSQDGKRNLLLFEDWARQTVKMKKVWVGRAVDCWAQSTIQSYSNTCYECSPKNPGCATAAAADAFPVTCNRCRRVRLGSAFSKKWANCPAEWANHKLWVPHQSMTSSCRSEWLKGMICQMAVSAQCYAPYITQYIAVANRQLANELDRQLIADRESCEALCTQRLSTTVCFSSSLQWHLFSQIRDLQICILFFSTSVPWWFVC